MSFTNEVSEELLRLPLKKTCCRKALLLGILCGAKHEEDILTLYTYQRSVAELAADLLTRVFHAEAVLTDVVRAGRQTCVLTVCSRSVASFLEDLDGGVGQGIAQAVGFRCTTCAQEFLRGVFLGCATVNDPHKGYHLEFVLPTEGRAETLFAFLTDTVGKPGKARRGARTGLYYKNNSAISDLLYWIGCSKTSFDVTNASIERDIRNNENRATNCVARNISRSVDAAQKQRSAIEHLIATRKIDTLSEELRYTAYLRLEHESASLTELALMHEPPLTKSGLNRRLGKLLALSEKET